MAVMSKERWRVGALAQAAGLTVRALHYYHQFGVLTPSARTDAGHRLYTAADVGRLYHILALRHLGLRLPQIGAVLDQHGADLRTVVRAHLAESERQLAAQARLTGLLRQVLTALEGMDHPTTDTLIQVMEAMTMVERYLTPEQVAQLRERHRALGDAAGTQGAQAWAELTAAADAAHRAGLDPTSPQVQAIARRWQELIERYTGGDARIVGALQAMIATEGIGQASRGTVSPELAAYMAAALASAEGGVSQ
jgi:DNA-binding transcriptional MerR regulator